MDTSVDLQPSKVENLVTSVFPSLENQLHVSSMTILDSFPSYGITRNYGHCSDHYSIDSIADHVGMFMLCVVVGTLSLGLLC